MSIGQFKFTNANLITDFKTQSNLLTLELHKDSLYAVKQILDEITQGGVYVSEIKHYKHKRTLDQNAYLWVLCQRISEKVGTTKEEVYRSFIKDKGQFDILCIQDKALDRFIKNWSDKGIGWFCETDTSKIENCTNVLCYYGTSVYDTAEMAQVLDEIINECKNLNISTDVTGYEE